MKRIVSIVGLSLVLLAPLWPKSSLIVYDGEKGKSEAYKSSCYVYNLLEHFSLEEKSILQISEYEPGMAKTRDYVFVVFEEGHPEMSEDFLQDMLETQATIAWISMHIERILDISSGKWGIWHEAWEEREDWKIYYKGEDFAKEDPGLNILGIKDQAQVECLATVEDSEGHKYPYVLKAKNFWYFADSPFSYALEGGRFLILADLLHEILGEDHPASHQALLRIEDVNPEDDPRALKKIANYLYSKNIPFQVSLIPIYKNAEDQSEVYLSERPKIIDALKYMAARGGTLVLHGATHQHRGVSGEDYEFWDDVAGVPIPHESPDWVDQRIQLALKECSKNGLYPLAWETPHYSASKSDYQTIAKYFDAFYDRIMAAELSGTQQMFPYWLKLKELGVSIIPENLGYVDFKKPKPALLLENAKNMNVVRDGLASFFFHSFVPLKHLKKLIKEMTELGWEFISARDFPCNVRTEYQWVTSEGGEGKITASNQYVHKLLLDRRGRVEKEEYSESRQKGIVTENISIPKGSLYVLEAVDLLPEKREGNPLRRLQKSLAGLFPEKEEKGIVSLSRSLILFSKKVTKEEDFDQKSFESVLKIFGFNPEIRDRTEVSNLALKDIDLFVVPYVAARSLTRAEQNILLDFVKEGGLLITDGKTELATTLGLRFIEKEISVGEVKDLSLPSPNLRWNPRATLYPFSAPDMIVLAKDESSENPLAAVISLGMGRVLFLATLFDPLTAFGISRFSYFPFYLKNNLGLPFNVRRNNLEFYFDPGFHQSTSWEKLVNQWKASGVKIVYLAAWHFYERYAFDYDYFIRLCHNQGIAAYAWFEFPQVSPLFWQSHPLWREKTATGEDALSSWRLQMNLFNEQARNGARDFLRQIMKSYDWDGVNLAELNFDTDHGASNPAKFTPLNQDVRREFRKQEGFDPVELFNPLSSFYWKKNRATFDKFLKFRCQVIRDLHLFFLEELERIKREKSKDMEVIVTAMDSLLHPEIIEECGINTLDIVSLMDDYPFTLQVEDPRRSWAESPSRYLSYYNVYKEYIQDPRRLMFDINCIADRDISDKPLPSTSPTGVEIATNLFYATFASGRAGIYSESTISPYDMDILPFVLGSDVEIGQDKGGYVIQAKEPFVLSLNSQDVFPYLNEKKWPFYGASGISLPSGRSFLSFKKTGLLDPQALSLKMIFDGDITGLVQSGNVYSLSYNSLLPVSLTFNRPLENVNLDSQALPLSPEKNGVVLPKGLHHLEITTESGPAYVVDVVGYISSSAFYIVGLLSVSLLLGIYLFSRITG